MISRILEKIKARMPQAFKKPRLSQNIELPDQQLDVVDPRVANYSNMSKVRGVNDLSIVLSFDCDTDEDITASEKLESELRRRGIVATYAVPGVQLERGAATYKRLAENGAEFMNHGFQPHAEWRENRYYSVTFYSEMETEEILHDMQRGHEVVSSVTGSRPGGFRAPHFGCFQATDQLALIYEQANELGYQYCSTTIPQAGLTNGPFFNVDGVWEVPLSGSYRYPETLLDSWTYLSSYENYALKEEYYELFEETVRKFCENNISGLLCFYVDPAHVIGQDPFLKALDAIKDNKLPSLQYRDVVAMANRRLNP